MGTAVLNLNLGLQEKCIMMDRQPYRAVLESFDILKPDDTDCGGI